MFKEYKKQHSTECKVELVDDLHLSFKVNSMIFVPKEKKKHYNRAEEKRKMQREIDEEIDEER